MMLTAKKISALALMTALLSCGKIVLNFIPNVEVISLFCALYGYVFGFISVIPVCVFVVIEIAQWGIQTWVISYFIHFNLIVVIFSLLKILKVKNVFILTICMTILTALFGVLTTFVDVIIGSGFYKFFNKFAILYVNGVTFYIIQIISNTIQMLVIFYPLQLLFAKIKEKLQI